MLLFFVCWLSCRVVHLNLNNQPRIDGWLVGCDEPSIPSSQPKASPICRPLICGSHECHSQSRRRDVGSCMTTHPHPFAVAPKARSQFVMAADNDVTCVIWAMWLVWFLSNEIVKETIGLFLFASWGWQMTKRRVLALLGPWNGR